MLACLYRTLMVLVWFRKAEDPTRLSARVQDLYTALHNCGYPGWDGGVRAIGGRVPTLPAAERGTATPGRAPGTEAAPASR